MAFIMSSFDALAALCHNRICDACSERVLEMNTVAIGLDERTALELGQLARERAVEPSILVGEAIRAYLRSAARDDMDQEAEAFRRLHPDMLATIPGEYAAVYRGQLVDHDADQLALYQRIKARFEGQLILIRQVRSEVEQTIMVHSPRIEYE
jgi:hypothetical protein